MKESPIVAEVRRVRDEYARQFNYDLRAIFEDIKKREKASDRPVVDRSKRAMASDAPIPKPPAAG